MTQIDPSSAIPPFARRRKALDAIEAALGDDEEDEEETFRLAADEMTRAFAARVAQAEAMTRSEPRLAFDRASVRREIAGKDGQLWRLEIDDANLSKACVNPYLGHEIPNGRELGLEPDKVYNLLRHPDELKRAASTANMIPVLRRHQPISADDHQPWDVVGGTGSNARMEGPYLRNGLSIWAREGVDGIKSDRKKELSCGYAYRAEMTPGVFDGKRYDGIMRDLRFNHVALVEDGRAGPDVVVGDSAEGLMDNRALAKQMASLAARQITVGAMAAYLQPRLAMDAKLPDGFYGKVFDGVPVGPKYKQSKPTIARRVRDLARPLLAKDASLDDVEKVLDMLDGHEIDGGDESVSQKQHDAMGAAAGGHSELGIPQKVGAEFAHADKGKGFDAGPMMDFLKGKGATDEEMEAFKGMLPKPAAATDEEPETDEEKKKREEAEKAKGAEDKKAMDQQIKIAVDQAVKGVREGLEKQHRELRAAEAEVRPWVGELNPELGLDSAEKVRRHALKMLSVEGADTMHADALSAVIKAQPRPGGAGAKPRLGMDAAPSSAAKASFHERFPGSDRVKAA